MGDVREDRVPPNTSADRDWTALVHTGEALPGTGLAMVAEQMRADGPWPEDLADAPVILDTDIGGDADDALALVLAARCLPQLKLVLTNDESHGRRAEFARALLDELDRTDAVVVAGETVDDGDRYFCAHGLAPSSVTRPREDVLATVRAIVASTTGPVRWVGMGPMSNLAHIATKDPDLAQRLRVTQMGGGPQYRNPQRAEHNIRRDVSAAHTVMRAAAEGLVALEFVTSEVTFDPRNEVTAASPIYQALTVDGAPAWAGMLRAHMDQWFAEYHPGTMQHDALTLATALQLPFVDADRVAVALDDHGRMHLDEHDGVPVWMSTSANYSSFTAWLTEKLDPATVVTGLARQSG